MVELDSLLGKDYSKMLTKEFEKDIEEESFRKFLSALPVSKEEMIQNRSELQASFKEYNHCNSCKNILTCPNQMKGYAYLPKISDGNLLFYYRACKKKKALDKKNHYLEMVYSYGIPEDIREASMRKVYQDDKKRLPALTYLLDFLEEYQKGKRGKGLYLCGNFGCGKTYLIASLFNELAEDGVKSAMVFWPEYLRELRSSFTTDFDEKFNKVKRAPLLLIDDIGAENTTVWSRDEILCPLIQYRMSENLPTFFTSNLDIENLMDHFSVAKDKVDEVKSKRIIERIKQMTKQQEMVSENLRK